MYVQSHFISPWFLSTCSKMHELMKKASPEAIASNKAEMEEWEAEFERLQALRPVQATRDRIKGMDLPALEAQIKEQEASYPETSDEAEKVADILFFHFSFSKTTLGPRKT